MLSENRFKAKVLIVDDDKSLLDALKHTVTSMGCDVSIALNGRSALDLIEKENFAVVITDVRMPKMDGLSLLEAIEKSGKNTPVIVMSGYTGQTADQIDARGGVVLIEKPFTKAQIREIIEDFIYLLAAG